jgi:uncharacterized membrane protein
LSLTLTSGQNVVVDVVQQLLLLVQRLLGVVDVAVAADELRAEAVADQKLALVHHLLVELRRVLRY